MADAKLGGRKPATTKRLKAAQAEVDFTKSYPLPEALALVKANARAKFDETIEMSMNLGIDPRHADQMVRGLVVLPNGTGKTVRVGVFARGPKAAEATEAGCRRGRRGGFGRARAGGRHPVRPLHRHA